MNDANQITRSITLKDGQTMTLIHRPGQWLRVVEGTVWLTREGVCADVFLVAGRRWPVQAPGAVLIEGIGHARVIVTRPASALERAAYLVARACRKGGAKGLAATTRRLGVRRAS